MPYLDQILGPAVSESEHPPHTRDELPQYVFRTMSEEHFQVSFKQGFHISDGRNNYPAQKAADPELWGDEEAPEEGTVGGRWAYLGYLLGCEAGRVVKIEVHEEDGWQVHPWDEEGGYIHTFSPISIDRFVGWSEPIRGKTFDLIRDGSFQAHLG